MTMSSIPIFILVAALFLVFAVWRAAQLGRRPPTTQALLFAEADRMGEDLSKDEISVRDVPIDITIDKAILSYYCEKSHQ